MKLYSLFVCLLFSVWIFSDAQRDLSFSKGMQKRSTFLKQALNLPGISALFSVMRQPKLAIPHFSLRSINEVDLGLLKKRGIRYIIFDKDNTLR